MYFFECLNCHKIKEVKYKSRISKYCSKDCFYQGLKNRTITWGDKISKSLIGQTWDDKRKQKFSGENNPMWGKKSWSNGLTKSINSILKENGIKHSKFMLGKKYAKGSIRTESMRYKYSEIQKTKTGGLSPNWDNGSSFEPYAPEFNKKLKQFIKDRDFNICQTPNCMKIENLHIHHIDYNKKNNIIKNLITLCNNCHAKTIGKNNRLYWINYYSEIEGAYL